MGVITVRLQRDVETALEAMAGKLHRSENGLIVRNGVRFTYHRQAGLRAWSLQLRGSWLSWSSTTKPYLGGLVVCGTRCALTSVLLQHFVDELLGEALLRFSIAGSLD